MTQEELKKIFNKDRYFAEEVGPIQSSSPEDQLIIAEFNLNDYQDHNPFIDNWWGVEAYRAVNGGELPPQQVDDYSRYLDEEKQKFVEFLRSDIVRNLDFASVPSGNVNDRPTMFQLITAVKKSLVTIIRSQNNSLH